AHETIDDIVQGVVTHVTHVQLAARIRQHRAHVELPLGKARVVLLRTVRVDRAPVLLGGGLEGRRIVDFFHRMNLTVSGAARRSEHRRAGSAERRSYPTTSPSPAAPSRSSLVC